MGIRRKMCWHCDGRGVDATSGDWCWRCYGSGIIEVDDGADEDGEDEDEEGPDGYEPGRSVWSEES